MSAATADKPAKAARSRKPAGTATPRPAARAKAATATKSGTPATIKETREPKVKGVPAAIRRAAEALKQVSDATRLMIVMTLGRGPKNVTDLCAEVGGQSQPAVSHHLALLRHGRFIESSREGKNNVYSLTDTGRTLKGIVDTITGAKSPAVAGIN